jgi:aspartyl-tRNA(Asn)/glutamyl-tRNA(Gln) amidotransferase subunit A
MSDDELCFMSATQMASLMRRRQLSPVEVVGAILRRIERLEPSLNAMARMLDVTAREQARAAERALMAGDALGPLHGIPVTIKDATSIAGVPSDSGSYVTRGYVPSEDSVHVARMKAAGAIALGTTTTSEQCFSCISRNPLTGITHNPWRRGFNAGGSSAGAAVAAASGYGPLHDGSDGMGSTRVPAHFCGVYGFKPTYGRIAQYPVWNVDQMGVVGPLTRTVADAALLLHTISGPHPLDHTCSEAGPDDYPARIHEPLGPIRVAFSPDLGHARVEPAVARLVEAAVRKLESDLGLTVELVDIDFPANVQELARLFLACHMCTDAPSLPKFEHQMDPEVVACIRDGLRFSAKDYLDAREAKFRMVLSMLRHFERFDFLLTPSASVAAFPVERIQPEGWPAHPWDYLMWCPFSYPFNFSGQPAASVPCGFTEDGLPVGLQIVGRRFDELGVLKLSAAFERIQPWQQHRPPLAQLTPDAP